MKISSFYKVNVKKSLIGEKDWQGLVLITMQKRVIHSKFYTNMSKLNFNVFDVVVRF
jgi:hypothetical protein